MAAAGRRRARRAAGAAAALAGLALALFAWTGLEPSWRRPSIERGPGAVVGEPGERVTVFVLNVAKAGFHRGGLDFAPADAVRARLDRVAAAIRDADPDLVFLSEVVNEGGPVRFDQVEHLAAACGFQRWVSGDNYRFGWPLLRVRSGNAVLSRFELADARVAPLAGTRPFWSPTNNRRVLWVDAVLGEERLRLGSVRNDSYDLANNARQVDELLAMLDGRPALLAGDFNAAPGEGPLERLVADGAFTELVAAPPTHITDAPARRIDHAFAPASWRLVEHRVVDTGASDHLAVVAVFRRR